MSMQKFILSRLNIKADMEFDDIYRNSSLLKCGGVRTVFFDNRKNYDQKDNYQKSDCIS